MDNDESKVIIIGESSTDEDESKYVQKNINKEKDAKNEAEYRQPSVTYKEPRYFNIFGYGKNIFNRIDVMHERLSVATMATPTDKYYSKMLETLVDYNDRNNAPLFNEDL